MASTLAPPAASHYFSFTVPVDDEEIAASGPGGAGQQFDLIIVGPILSAKLCYDSLTASSDL